MAERPIFTVLKTIAGATPMNRCPWLKSWRRRWTEGKPREKSWNSSAPK
jgi:hypothetical protein